MNLTPILQRFGALVCMGRGHLRGKCVENIKAEGLPEQRKYECPRCHATWTRKINKREKKEQP